jgi:hypothetical protein
LCIYIYIFTPADLVTDHVDSTLSLQTLTVIYMDRYIYIYTLADLVTHHVDTGLLLLDSYCLNVYTYTHLLIRLLSMLIQPCPYYSLIVLYIYIYTPADHVYTPCWFGPVLTILLLFYICIYIYIYIYIRIHTCLSGYTPVDSALSLSFSCCFIYIYIYTYTHLLIWLHSRFIRPCS